MTPPTQDTGGVPPLREQWRKFSQLQKAMWLVVPCALLFMLSECRPGSRLYGFTMVGREGHTVLDFALGRIVFQGVRHPGKSDGDILVNGWVIEKTMVNEGSVPFELSSRRGVTRIRYSGYEFSLKDSGHTLQYGSNVFRLGPEKPTIMLLRDGSAQVITNDAKYRE